MGQVKTGFRAVLSSPWIYDTLQWLMGGRVGRLDFASNMVRAAAGSRILDLGCGTADLLAFLPAQVEYRGYDVSPEYIAAAHARFGGRGNFTCGLLSQADVLALPPFDIVIASGVLHHLDDVAAQTLLRVARHALRGGGRFVSVDCVYVPGQNKVARLLISRDRGQNVRDPEGYLSLARPVFDRVNGVLRHRRWIPYTHWMMEGTVAPPQ